MLRQMDSCSSGTGIGLDLTREAPIQPSANNAAISQYALVTPNHAHAMPPSAGPKIEVTCHTVPPHVAAFTYNSRGTICVSNADEAGSAKPRAMPAMNTTA